MSISHDDAHMIAMRLDFPGVFGHATEEEAEQLRAYNEAQERAALERRQRMRMSASGEIGPRRG